MIDNTMKKDYRSVILDLYNKEIDLPVLNKFLLCLPLRPGLMVWGFLQFIAILFIAGFAVGSLGFKVQFLHGFQLVQAVIIFIIIMISYLLDVINCMFLILGAKTKNANFLEVSYHFIKCKTLSTLVFFIISVFLKLTVHCYNWYYYNLDPWSNIIFLEDQALGCLVIVSQFYLLLLVRSQILKLEHPINLSSLYQKFYPERLPASSLITNEEKPQMTKINLDQDKDQNANGNLEWPDLTNVTVNSNYNNYNNNNGFVPIHK